MIKTRLIKLLNKSTKYILYNILWQWIGLICQIILIFALTNLINLLYLKQVTSTSLMVLGGIILTCLLVKYLCDNLVTRNAFKASKDVKKVLRQKVYDKVLRLGTRYQNYISSAELVQLTSEGVEQLEVYYGRYLPQFAYSLLAPITLFIVLSFTNLKAALFLLACVPLIPISIVLVQKIAKRLIHKYLDMYASLGDSFLENVQGMTTLKIYQADKKRIEYMDQEARHFRNVTMKVLTMQLNSTSVMDIIAYGGAVVGMIVALGQYHLGLINLGQTLRIILLASEFFLPLRLLGSYFHIAMNGMSASDRIFKLIDAKEPRKGDQDISSIDKIILENINFSYDQNIPVLNNLNITFTKGLQAIVGESGSGKSTLTKLLTNKLENYTGSVLIDGIELSLVKEECLLDRIIRVGHEEYLFKGSVKSNLSINSTISEEEMILALKKVNLYDFIQEQDGLNTLISDGGKNLSGGQRQRLALARAILAKGDVYIFDESTSNIDVESEALINKVIEELSKDKIVIVVAHRLKNVEMANKIYLLDQGKLAEQGNHDNLIKLEGIYNKMYSLQAKYENLGKGDM